MRLHPNQLQARLNDGGLLPVYYLSGAEPLQLLELADLIRAAARAAGYEERLVLNVEAGFDWGRLHEASASLSLFSSHRIIELRLGEHKPGREGGAALVEYAQRPHAENLLLMSSARIDNRTRQTKWFKALDQCGAWLQVWPVEHAQLPRWIAARCRQNGKRVSEAAAALIAQRVEGNLLAAKQELDKLFITSQGADINADEVLDMVVDSARFSAFELVESVFTGDAARVVRMLRGLRDEGVEPLSIYGALLWALRRANLIADELARGKSRAQTLRAHGVLPQRQAGLNALLRRFGSAGLAAGLVDALSVDKALKGAHTGDGWQLLERFMLFLAGGRALQSQDGY